MGSDNGREGSGFGDADETTTEVARPKSELEAKIGPVLDYFRDVTPMQKATILAICGRLNRERKDLNLDILARSLRYLGPLAFIAEHSTDEPRAENSENTEVVGEIAETFRSITEGLRRTGVNTAPTVGNPSDKRTTGSQTVPGALRAPAVPDTRTVAERMEDERRRMDAIVAARNGGSTGRRASQTFRAPTAAELADVRRAAEKEKAEKAGEDVPPKTEEKPGGLLASIRQTLGGVQEALDIGKEK